SVQRLGLQVATPGVNSSSGMNRINWTSGWPQLSSVAVAPAMAERLMKSRRCISTVNSDKWHVTSVYRKSKFEDRKPQSRKQNRQSDPGETGHHESQIKIQN